jgi:hypothetical protein
MTYQQVKECVLIAAIISSLVLAYTKNGADGVVLTAAQIAMSPALLDVGLSNVVPPSGCTGGIK